MGIVNCLTFFNEVEILQLRLHLLLDSFDRFIIIEADHTHSGQYKGFTLKRILAELGIVSDKIHVIELKVPSFEDEPNAWVRERLQRNVAAEYITEEDIVLASDCDEIINPELVDYLCYVSKSYPENILRVPMHFLMSRADMRVYNDTGSAIIWEAPFFCSKYHLNKYTLSDIREAISIDRNIDFSSIFVTEDNNRPKMAGWHFSWMGDIDRLKQKKDSFLHWNEVDIVDGFVPVENGPDVLGRTNHILKRFPLSELPKCIYEIDSFRKYFLL